MVHPKQQSPTTSRRTMTNQLIQAISPFEELLPSRSQKGHRYTHDNDDDDDDDACMACPFDEVRIVPPPPTSRTTREEPRQTRQECIPRLQRGGSFWEPRDGIPTAIVVPHSTSTTGSSAKDEDASQVSIEVWGSDARTLTPHPSFEKPSSVTATDFHHLYQAARELDEEDWPSDEDGPRNGCGWMAQFQCGSDGIPVVYKKKSSTVVTPGKGQDDSFSGRNRTPVFEI